MSLAHQIKRYLLQNSGYADWGGWYQLLERAHEALSAPPERQSFVDGVAAVERLLDGQQQLCRKDAPCEMCRELYRQIDALKRGPQHNTEK